MASLIHQQILVTHNLYAENRGWQGGKNSFCPQGCIFLIRETESELVSKWIEMLTVEAEAIAQ